MIKCEKKIFPSICKETRNATPRLSSATPRCLTHLKSPTKELGLDLKVGENGGGGLDWPEEQELEKCPYRYT